MTDAEVDALEAGSKIISKKSGKVREVVMTRKSRGRVMTAELLAIVKTRYGCMTSTVERWALKNRYERNQNE
jgi:hypothetical protein